MRTANERRRPTDGSAEAYQQDYPADYLRIERAATFRSEYFDGEIVAMSGGSPRHSLITTNILRELSARLKGRPCTAYECNLRVKVAATGLYTYPDASVVCEPLQFDDDRRDTVLNPTLLVEVLSDTTEAYVRGKKFRHYQQIASLREYVLVSQDSPILERFLRNADGTWALTTVTGLDASLELPSIGVTLPLAEVYDKVDFSDAAAAESEPPAARP